MDNKDRSEAYFLLVADHLLTTPGAYLENFLSAGGTLQILQLPEYKVTLRIQ